MCPHPPLPQPHFQFLLQSCPQFTSVIPAALASNLPFVWGDCPPSTAVWAVGRTERFRVLINAGPSEGEAWIPGSCLSFWPGHYAGSLAPCCFWMTLPLVGRPPSGQHPGPLQACRLGPRGLARGGPPSTTPLGSEKQYVQGQVGSGPGLLVSGARALHHGEPGERHCLLALPLPSLPKVFC